MEVMVTMNTENRIPLWLSIPLAVVGGTILGILIGTIMSYVMG